MADKEREKAIATGIGLIAAGNSISWSSQQSGIARSTLYDAYLRHLGPDAPNKDEERKASEERIIAGAAAIAEATITQMAERLERGDVDDKTLTAWHSVSTQSMGRLRGWDNKGRRDEDAGSVGRLTQLLGSLSDGNLEATLSIKRAAPIPVGASLDLEDGGEDGVG